MDRFRENHVSRPRSPCFGGSSSVKACATREPAATVTLVERHFSRVASQRPRSMPSEIVDNPYELRPESVQTPPIAFRDVLRWIGPGLIIASAVVGTGELIATTVLGAENGYRLLWLVVLSCVIKVIVQSEIGRYTVATGKTGLEGLDRVPGPRFRVSWVVWIWFLMQTTTLMTISGMFAGIAEVLNRIVPAVTIGAWVWVVTIVTLVVLVIGRYGFVEKVSVGLVIIFTALTVSAAVLLGMKPEYFSWPQMVDGLMFHLPIGGLGIAVAVFGITGVGSSDLVMYPYWCIEKGYARFAGPRDDTPAWLSRSRGWVKVMGVDVLCSMFVYTFATIAFYLLGAGVLHGLDVVPRGAETIAILSNIYTETLGGWSLYVFLAGAVAVLYSSVFAGSAATARVYADFVGLLGVYDRRNYRSRRRATQLFIGFVLFVPVIYYFLLPEPVMLVTIGGIAQALMLPIVGFSILYLRYVHLPESLVPKGWVTLALWVASVITAVMMGYSVLQRLG